MQKRFAILIISAATVLLAWSACTGDASGGASTASTVLAKGGAAKQQIVVAADASEGLRLAAEELATYLGCMSGAEFEVVAGDGATGVAVGVVGDFPKADHGMPLDSEDPLRRDDYLIRTHEKGVYVIGASDTGATLAVWDLLHRLGYRLYFLTNTWEIVPDRPDLSITVDTVERPAYVTRQAPRGAPWSDRGLWNRWRRRNRVLSSFQLSTGHSYGRIISAQREQFAKHPEYYALVDGERQSTGGNLKFCISNSGLRQLVVDYAVETIQNAPELDSISLDPSDGGGWCECSNCAAMGSVSDRVVILAGEAAEAINRLRAGPKYIGIYAYNQHSPPPNVEVHPRVIVSIATSFIRGGYTLEELVEGWRDRDATLGIRDYHDVFTWSHDLPNKARGGNIEYLRTSIPHLYEQGARFMNSENSDSWGANGLGYWLTPRLLWTTDAAGRVDELIEDFLQNSFGPAKQPMRVFYTLLNLDDTVRSSEDMIARMYRRLNEARRLTGVESILLRLDDLVLYTRYLELYHAYRRAEGDERQRAFERVWQHAYRMRDRMLISTQAICMRDRFRDKSVVVPAELKWNTKPGDNPWKSEEPFEREEINSILANGILANEPTTLDFELVEYSDDLTPAATLNLPEKVPGRYPDQFRGRQVIYTWLPDTLGDDNRRRKTTINLQVTGGLIPHYRDRGNVDLALYAACEATLKPVAQDRTVPPDGEPRSISLVSPHSGLHRLEWSDGNDLTRIAWPKDLPLTFRSTMDEPLRLQGRWSLVFYVPRETRTVAGFATATTGRLLDGSGNTVYSFEDMDEPDYFQVIVAEGQDATLWRFENCSGSRMLMTVPPYLAPSPSALLLPREVVEADR